MPDFETVTHAIIMWIVVGLSTAFFIMIGFMYNKLERLKTEMTENVPTKDEVRQIAASLQSIAQRLDSLYSLLAQKALKEN